MPFDTKSPEPSSDFEIDSRDIRYESRLKTARLLDNIRLGLTTLTLLSALTILGTAGDALAVYNTTSIPSTFQLPLWPTEFDIRPTVALVVGGSIVALTSIISLAFSRVPLLRSYARVHTSLTITAPLTGFAAAMIAMIFFYAINASTTVDTLQSWSCQWSGVGMTMKPYFGTLCRESKTALYLAIILVPVEAVTLSVASYQLILERKKGHAGGAVVSRSPKRASPVEPESELSHTESR
ncbi:hypothetical protein BX600DRAFT_510428 [Xylariales sp. PMI_506]|nr:hypothetical protein BX600DRAFT_510428 [Xylariales sp. PMI_506]